MFLNLLQLCRTTAMSNDENEADMILSTLTYNG